MDFFSYLNSDFHEKIAQDSTVSWMKSKLEDSFPKRIRWAKRLIDFVPKDTAARIVAETVALIKTIPGDKEHLLIARYVMRVLRGDRTREDFIKYLVRTGDVDETRAEMIADDQMSKIVVRFLVEKWRKQGCKRVRWVHKGASDPREYHLRRWNGKSGKRNGRPNGLNGYEFEIDKPPVINKKTKERGYPGHLINCHCHLEPIWG